MKRITIYEVAKEAGVSLATVSRVINGAEVVKAPTKAKVELGWTAQYGIDEMCEDSWRWQSQNPNGYAE